MNILQMSLFASIFILIIVILRSLAVNVLPKKTFSVLWGLACCQLLLPFSVESLLAESPAAESLARISLPYLEADMPKITAAVKGAMETGITAHTSFLQPVSLWALGAIGLAVFFGVDMCGSALYGSFYGRCI